MPGHIYISDHARGRRPRRYRAHHRHTTDTALHCGLIAVGVALIVAAAGGVMTLALLHAGDLVHAVP